MAMTNWWQGAGQDVRFAARSMRRHWGLSAVIVLTLALAIGANTAIFSLLNGLLLRSLPVHDPQSLMVLQWTAHHRPDGFHSSSSYGDCRTDYSKGHVLSCSFSMPMFQEFQQKSHTLAEMTAYGGASMLTLTGHGPASTARIEWVAGNYFSTLGVPASVGRTLTPGDDKTGAPPTAVLSYNYWQREFGGDRGIVGKTVTFNRIPVAVVGVASRDFAGLAPGSNFDGWMALSAAVRTDTFWRSNKNKPTSIYLVLAGRLRPGVAVSQAQAELNGMFRNALLNGSAPLAKAADDPRLELMSAQSGLNGDRREFGTTLTVLMWMVGAILLIACTNIAGLLAGRIHARGKELAVRRALGAGSGRILRQLLTESLVLSVCGGVAGLGLAWVAAHGLKAMLLGGASDRVLEIGLDGRVLLFTLAATVATGVLFGLAPALRGARGQLAGSLKDATGNAAAASRRRGVLRFLHLGNSLVVAQIAVCLVVLTGAGLMVRTLKNLRAVNPGFDTQNLLLFSLDGSTLGYKGERVLQLNDRIQKQIAALPGVRSVSYSESAMISGSLSSTGFTLVPGTNAPEIESDWMPVGLGFFKTMGMSLLQGRNFEARDFTPPPDRPTDDSAAAKAPPRPPLPVIVNQAFVQKFLKDGRVLGREMGYGKDGRPQYLIVGVASNAKYESLRGELAPTTYSPLTYPFATYEVRTAGSPMAMLPAVARAVHSVEPNLPLARPSSQSETIDQMLVAERMMAKLASIFGGLALLLAGIGLYALLAQEVARRTREIGIRMALGAERAQVLGMVLTQGAALALVGAALGLAGAWGATRYLSTMLYGVKPTDMVTLAVVAAILLATAAAACWLPARRATRVDPMIALRYE